MPEVLGAAGAGLMAHQLIDHPGRDAIVLQPGREGVPNVVRAPEIDRLNSGSPEGTAGASVGPALPRLQEHRWGAVRWTRRRRNPASSPKRRPVPSRVRTWSHQNRGKRASSWPAASGVSTRRLAWRNTWWGSTLPAAELGRADLVDGALPQERAHMVAQPAVGHDQGAGAALGIGRPVGLPQVRPGAERQPPSASSLPGVTRDLQPLLSCQGAGLVFAGDRLGALGAVIEQPPDLEGHQTSTSANAAAPR
jgi:hypothetical protein